MVKRKHYEYFINGALIRGVKILSTKEEVESVETMEEQVIKMECLAKGHKLELKANTFVNRMSEINKKKKDGKVLLFCAGCQQCDKSNGSIKKFELICERFNYKFTSYDKDTRTLYFTCHCGRESHTHESNFTKKKLEGLTTKGCRGCSQNIKKRNLEDLKEVFTKQKCELLTTEYKNNKQKLEYICICGNKSKIVLSDFNAGKRCMKCRDERTIRTCQERYGSKYFITSEEFINIMTIIYGVKSALHNPELFKKAMRNSYFSSPYTLPNKKVINVMGYEWICFDILLGLTTSCKYTGEIYQEEDLSNDVFSFPYQDETGVKTRFYYPDIIIKKDILIEVKSVWTFNNEIKRNICKFKEVAKTNLLEVWIFSSKKKLLDILTYDTDGSVRWSDGRDFTGRKIQSNKPGSVIEEPEEEVIERNCDVINEVIENL